MSYYKQQKPRVITLQYKDENEGTLITHTFQADGLQLSDLLEKFRNFAGGMSYYVDGEFVFNSMEDQRQEDEYRERSQNEEDRKYNEIQYLKARIDELEDILYNSSSSDEECCGGCGPSDDSEEEDELSEEEKEKINNCLEEMKAKVAAEKEGNSPGFYPPTAMHPSEWSEDEKPIKRCF